MLKLISILLLAQFSVPMHTGALAVAPSGGGPPTTNLLAWYKADSLSASPVTTWADSSGNGHPLTGVSSPTWSSAQINGLPAVTMNGSSQYFTAASSIPVNDGTNMNISIYIVFKPASVTTKSSFTSNSSVDSLVYAIKSTSQQVLEYQQTAQIGSPSTTPLTASTWYETAFTYGTSAQNFYLNGTADGAYTDSTYIPNPINAIGANFNAGTPSEFANVQVAEILVYSSSAYQTAVHTYLMGRYGI